MYLVKLNRALIHRNIEELDNACYLILENITGGYGNHKIYIHILNLSQEPKGFKLFMAVCK